MGSAIFVPSFFQTFMSLNKKINTIPFRTLTGVILFVFVVTNTPAYAQVTPFALNPLASRSGALINGLKIPETFGKVIESFDGRRGESVIVIQDAHAHFEAQKNIAEILQFLSSHHNITTIGMEGAEGKVDLSFFRALPYPELKQKILLNDVRSGGTAGVEYFAITSEREVQLIGVDSNKDYLENVKQYAELTSRKEAHLRSVRMLKQRLEPLKHVLFSEAVKDLLNLFEQFDQGHISADEFLRRLFPITEKYAFPLRENSELAKIKPLFLSGQGSKENAVQAMEDLLGRLNTEKLSGEVERFFTDTLIPLAKNPEEKTLLELEHYAGLLQKGARLEFSKSQVKEFKKLSEKYSEDFIAAFCQRQYEQTYIGGAVRSDDPTVSLDKLVQQILSFYQTVDTRDEVFVRNIKKYLRGKHEYEMAFVAGGFHTEGVTERLKKEKISFAVLQPGITQTEKENRYEEQMVKWGNILRNVSTARPLFHYGLYETGSFDGTVRINRAVRQHVTKYFLRPYLDALAREKGVGTDELVKMLANSSEGRLFIPQSNTVSVAFSLETFLQALRISGKYRGAHPADLIAATAIVFPHTRGQFSEAGFGTKLPTPDTILHVRRDLTEESIKIVDIRRDTDNKISTLRVQKSSFEEEFKTETNPPRRNSLEEVIKLLESAVEAHTLAKTKFDTYFAVLKEIDEIYQNLETLFAHAQAPPEELKARLETLTTSSESQKQDAEKALTSASAIEHQANQVILNLKAKPAIFNLPDHVPFFDSDGNPVELARVFSIRQAPDGRFGVYGLVELHGHERINDQIPVGTTVFLFQETPTAKLTIVADVPDSDGNLAKLTIHGSDSPIHLTPDGRFGINGWAGSSRVLLLQETPASELKAVTDVLDFKGSPAKLTDVHSSHSTTDGRLGVYGAAGGENALLLQETPVSKLKVVTDILDAEGYPGKLVIVHSIHSTPDGRVWIFGQIGSHEVLLFRETPTSEFKVVTDVLDSKGNPARLSGVKSIHPISGGRFVLNGWVGERSAILLPETPASTLKVTDVLDSGGNPVELNSVESIHLTTDGRLGIYGLVGGEYALLLQEIPPSKFFKVVTDVLDADGNPARLGEVESIHSTPDGRFEVFGMVGGRSAFLLEGKDGLLRVVSVFSDLLRVTRSSDGVFWYAKPNGLHRFIPPSGFGTEQNIENFKQRATRYYQLKHELIKAADLAKPDDFMKAYDEIVQSAESLSASTEKITSEKDFLSAIQSIIESGIPPAFIGGDMKIIRRELTALGKKELDGTTKKLADQIVDEVVEELYTDEGERSKWRAEIIKNLGSFYIGRVMPSEKIRKFIEEHPNEWPSLAPGLLQIFFMAGAGEAAVFPLSEAIAVHGGVDEVRLRAYLKHELVHFLALKGQFKIPPNFEPVTWAVTLMEFVKHSRKTIAEGEKALDEIFPDFKKPGLKELYQKGKELGLTGETGFLIHPGVSDRKASYFSIDYLVSIARGVYEELGIPGEHLLDAYKAQAEAGIIMAGVLMGLNDKAIKEGKEPIKPLALLRDFFEALYERYGEPSEDDLNHIFGSNGLVEELHNYASRLTGRRISMEPATEGLWEYIPSSDPDSVEAKLRFVITDLYRRFYDGASKDDVKGQREAARERGLAHIILTVNRVFHGKKDLRDKASEGKGARPEFRVLWDTLLTPAIVSALTRHAENSAKTLAEMQSYRGAPGWMARMLRDRYHIEHQLVADALHASLPLHLRYLDSLLYRFVNFNGTAESLNDPRVRSKAVEEAISKTAGAFRDKDKIGWAEIMLRSSEISEDEGLLRAIEQNIWPEYEKLFKEAVKREELKRTYERLRRQDVQKQFDRAFEQLTDEELSALQEEFDNLPDDVKEAIQKGVRQMMQDQMENYQQGRADIPTPSPGKGMPSQEGGGGKPGTSQGKPSPGAGKSAPREQAASLEELATELDGLENGVDQIERQLGELSSRLGDVKSKTDSVGSEAKELPHEGERKEAGKSIQDSAHSLQDQVQKTLDMARGIEDQSKGHVESASDFKEGLPSPEQGEPVENLSESLAAKAEALKQKLSELQKLANDLTGASDRLTQELEKPAKDIDPGKAKSRADAVGEKAEQMSGKTDEVRGPERELGRTIGQIREELKKLERSLANQEVHAKSSAAKKRLEDLKKAMDQAKAEEAEAKKGKESGEDREPEAGKGEGGHLPTPPPSAKGLDHIVGKVGGDIPPPTGHLNEKRIGEMTKEELERAERAEEQALLERTGLNKDERKEYESYRKPVKSLIDDASEVLKKLLIPTIDPELHDRLRRGPVLRRVVEAGIGDEEVWAKREFVRPRRLILTVLIDRSGSMGGEKMLAAKMMFLALLEVIFNLNEALEANGYKPIEFEVGLYEDSEDPQLQVSHERVARDVKPWQKQRIIYEILKKLEAGGGTDASRALNAYVERLRRRVESVDENAEDVTPLIVDIGDRDMDDAELETLAGIANKVAETNHVSYFPLSIGDEEARKQTQKLGTILKNGKAIIPKSFQDAPDDLIDTIGDALLPDAGFSWRQLRGFGAKTAGFGAKAEEKIEKNGLVRIGKYRHFYAQKENGREFLIFKKDGVPELRWERGPGGVEMPNLFVPDNDSNEALLLEILMAANRPGINYTATSQDGKYLLRYATGIELEVLERNEQGEYKLLKKITTDEKPKRQETTVPNFMQLANKDELLWRISTLDSSQIQMAVNGEFKPVHDWAEEAKSLYLVEVEGGRVLAFDFASPSVSIIEKDKDEWYFKGKLDIDINNTEVESSGKIVELEGETGVGKGTLLRAAATLMNEEIFFIAGNEELDIEDLRTYRTLGEKKAGVSGRKASVMAIGQHRGAWVVIDEIHKIKQQTINHLKSDIAAKKHEWFLPDEKGVLRSRTVPNHPRDRIFATSNLERSGIHAVASKSAADQATQRRKVILPVGWLEPNDEVNMQFDYAKEEARRLGIYKEGWSDTDREKYEKELRDLIVDLVKVSVDERLKFVGYDVSERQKIYKDWSLLTNLDFKPKNPRGQELKRAPSPRAVKNMIRHFIAFPFDRKYRKWSVVHHYFNFDAEIDTRRTYGAAKINFEAKGFKDEDNLPALRLTKDSFVLTPEGKLKIVPARAVEDKDKPAEDFWASITLPLHPDARERLRNGILPSRLFYWLQSPKNTLTFYHSLQAHSLGRHLIFVGEQETGKSTLGEIIAELLSGPDLIIQPVGRSTSREELMFGKHIGEEGRAFESGWLPGSVPQAMNTNGHGKVLLMEETPQGKPGVIAVLNEVSERGYLLDPRTDQPIRTAEGFTIIHAINPPGIGIQVQAFSDEFLERHHIESFDSLDPLEAQEFIVQASRRDARQVNTQLIGEMEIDARGQPVLDANGEPKWKGLLGVERSIRKLLAQDRTKLPRAPGVGTFKDVVRELMDHFEFKLAYSKKLPQEVLLDAFLKIFTMQGRPEQTAEWRRIVKQAFKENGLWNDPDASGVVQEDGLTKFLHGKDSPELRGVDVIVDLLKASRIPKTGNRDIDAILVFLQEHTNDTSVAWRLLRLQEIIRDLSKKENWTTKPLSEQLDHVFQLKEIYQVLGVVLAERGLKAKPPRHSKNNLDSIEQIQNSIRSLLIENKWPTGIWQSEVSDAEEWKKVFQPLNIEAMFKPSRPEDGTFSTVTIGQILLLEIIFGKIQIFSDRTEYVSEMIKNAAEEIGTFPGGLQEWLDKAGSIEEKKVKLEVYVNGLKRFKQTIETQIAGRFSGSDALGKSWDELLSELDKQAADTETQITSIDPYAVDRQRLLRQFDELNARIKVKHENRPSSPTGFGTDNNKPVQSPRQGFGTAPADRRGGGAELPTPDTILHVRRDLTEESIKIVDIRRDTDNKISTLRVQKSSFEEEFKTETNPPRRNSLEEAIKLLESAVEAHTLAKTKFDTYFAVLKETDEIYQNLETLFAHAQAPPEELKARLETLLTSSESQKKDAEKALTSASAIEHQANQAISKILAKIALPPITSQSTWVKLPEESSYTHLINLMIMAHGEKRIRKTISFNIGEYAHIVSIGDGNEVHEFIVHDGVSMESTDKNNLASRIRRKHRKSEVLDIVQLPDVKGKRRFLSVGTKGKAFEYEPEHRQRISGKFARSIMSAAIGGLVYGLIFYRLWPIMREPGAIVWPVAGALAAMGMALAIIELPLIFPSRSILASKIKKEANKITFPDYSDSHFMMWLLTIGRFFVGIERPAITFIRELPHPFLERDNKGDRRFIISFKNSDGTQKLVEFDIEQSGEGFAVTDLNLNIWPSYYTQLFDLLQKDFVSVDQEVIRVLPLERVAGSIRFLVTQDTASAGQILQAIHEYIVFDGGRAVRVEKDQELLANQIRELSESGWTASGPTELHVTFPGGGKEDVFFGTHYEWNQGIPRGFAFLNTGTGFGAEEAVPELRTVQLEYRDFLGKLIPIPDQLRALENKKRELDSETVKLKVHQTALAAVTDAFDKLKTLYETSKGLSEVYGKLEKTLEGYAPPPVSGAAQWTVAPPDHPAHQLAQSILGAYPDGKVNAVINLTDVDRASPDRAPSEDITDEIFVSVGDNGAAYEHIYEGNQWVNDTKHYLAGLIETDFWRMDIHGVVRYEDIHAHRINYLVHSSNTFEGYYPSNFSVRSRSWMRLKDSNKLLAGRISESLNEARLKSGLSPDNLYVTQVSTVRMDDGSIKYLVLTNRGDVNFEIEQRKDKANFVWRKRNTTFQRVLKETHQGNPIDGFIEIHGVRVPAGERRFLSWGRYAFKTNTHLVFEYRLSPLGKLEVVSNPEEQILAKAIYDHLDHVTQIVLDTPLNIIPVTDSQKQMRYLIQLGAEIVGEASFIKEGTTERTGTIFPDIYFLRSSTNKTIPVRFGDQTVLISLGTAQSGEATAVAHILSGLTAGESEHSREVEKSIRDLISQVDEKKRFIGGQQASFDQAEARAKEAVEHLAKPVEISPEFVQPAGETKPFFEIMMELARILPSEYQLSDLEKANEPVTRRFVIDASVLQLEKSIDGLWSTARSEGEMKSDIMHFILYLGGFFMNEKEKVKALIWRYGYKTGSSMKTSPDWTLSWGDRLRGPIPVKGQVLELQFLLLLAEIQRTKGLYDEARESMDIFDIKRKELSRRLEELAVQKSAEADAIRDLAGNLDSYFKDEVNKFVMRVGFGAEAAIPDLDQIRNELGILIREQIAGVDKREELDLKIEEFRVAGASRPGIAGQDARPTEMDTLYRTALSSLTEALDKLKILESSQDALNRLYVQLKSLLEAPAPTQAAGWSYVTDHPLNGLAQSVRQAHGGVADQIIPLGDDRYLSVKRDGLFVMHYRTGENTWVHSDQEGIATVLNEAHAGGELGVFPFATNRGHLALISYSKYGKLKVSDPNKIDPEPSELTGTIGDALSSIYSSLSTARSTSNDFGLRIKFIAEAKDQHGLSHYLIFTNNPTVVLEFVYRDGSWKEARDFADALQTPPSNPFPYTWFFPIKGKAIPSDERRFLAWRIWENLLEFKLDKNGKLEFVQEEEAVLSRWIKEVSPSHDPQVIPLSDDSAESRYLIVTAKDEPKVLAVVSPGLTENEAVETEENEQFKRVFGEGKIQWIDAVRPIEGTEEQALMIFGRETTASNLSTDLFMQGAAKTVDKKLHVESERLTDEIEKLKATVAVQKAEFEKAEADRAEAENAAKKALQEFQQKNKPQTGKHFSPWRLADASKGGEDEKWAKFPEVLKEAHGDTKIFKILGVENQDENFLLTFTEDGGVGSFEWMSKFDVWAWGRKSNPSGNHTLSDAGRRNYARANEIKNAHGNSNINDALVFTDFEGKSRIVTVGAEGKVFEFKVGYDGELIELTLHQSEIASIRLFIDAAKPRTFTKIKEIKDAEGNTRYFIFGYYDLPLPDGRRSDDVFELVRNDVKKTVEFPRTVEFKSVLNKAHGGMPIEGVEEFTLPETGERRLISWGPSAAGNRRQFHEYRITKEDLVPLNEGESHLEGLVFHHPERYNLEYIIPPIAKERSGFSYGQSASLLHPMQRIFPLRNVQHIWILDEKTVLMEGLQFGAPNSQFEFASFARDELPAPAGFGAEAAIPDLDQIRNELGILIREQIAGVDKREELDSKKKELASKITELSAGVNPIAELYRTALLSLTKALDKLKILESSQDALNRLYVQLKSLLEAPAPAKPAGWSYVTDHPLNGLAESILKAHGGRAPDQVIDLEDGRYLTLSGDFYLHYQDQGKWVHTKSEGFAKRLNSAHNSTFWKRVFPFRTNTNKLALFGYDHHGRLEVFGEDGWNIASSELEGTLGELVGKITEKFNTVRSLLHLPPVSGSNKIWITQITEVRHDKYLHYIIFTNRADIVFEFSRFKDGGDWSEEDRFSLALTGDATDAPIKGFIEIKGQAIPADERRFLAWRFAPGVESGFKEYRLNDQGELEEVEEDQSLLSRWIYEATDGFHLDMNNMQVVPVTDGTGETRYIITQILDTSRVLAVVTAGNSEEEAISTKENQDLLKLIRGEKFSLDGAYGLKDSQGNPALMVFSETDKKTKKAEVLVYGASAEQESAKIFRAEADRLTAEIENLKTAIGTQKTEFEKAEAERVTAGNAAEKALQEFKAKSPEPPGKHFTPWRLAGASKGGEDEKWAKFADEVKRWEKSLGVQFYKTIYFKDHLGNERHLSFGTLGSLMTHEWSAKDRQWNSWGWHQPDKNPAGPTAASGASRADTGFANAIQFAHKSYDIYDALVFTDFDGKTRLITVGEHGKAFEFLVTDSGLAILPSVNFPDKQSLIAANIQSFIESARSAGLIAGKQDYEINFTIKGIKEVKDFEGNSRYLFFITENSTAGETNRALELLRDDSKKIITFHPDTYFAGVLQKQHQNKFISGIEEFTSPTTGERRLVSWGPSADGNGTQFHEYRIAKEGLIPLNEGEAYSLTWLNENLSRFPAAEVEAKLHVRSLNTKGDSSLFVPVHTHFSVVEQIWNLGDKIVLAQGKVPGEDTKSQFASFVRDEVKTDDHLRFGARADLRTERILQKVEAYIATKDGAWSAGTTRSQVSFSEDDPNVATVIAQDYWLELNGKMTGYSKQRTFSVKGDAVTETTVGFGADRNDRQIPVPVLLAGRYYYEAFTNDVLNILAGDKSGSGKAFIAEALAARRSSDVLEHYLDSVREKLIHVLGAQHWIFAEGGENILRTLLETRDQKLIAALASGVNTQILLLHNPEDVRGLHILSPQLRERLAFDKINLADRSLNISTLRQKIADLGFHGQPLVYFLDPAKLRRDFPEALDPTQAEHFRSQVSELAQLITAYQIASQAVQIAA